LLKKKSYFINKIGIVFHSFLKNIKKTRLSRGEFACILRMKDATRGSVKLLHHTLISTSTPLGNSSFINASMVLEVVP
jgi:hypothetical protein